MAMKVSLLARKPAKLSRLIDVAGKANPADWARQALEGMDPFHAVSTKFNSVQVPRGSLALQDVPEQIWTLQE
jgi:hypothetical protein